MRVERFLPEDFAALPIQPHQARWRKALLGGDWSLLGDAPHQAWTVFAGKDFPEVIGCGGFVDAGQGRARAWAVLADGLGGRMTELTRIARRGLEMAPYRRIDIEIDANFRPARRWATLLGFRREGVMRAFNPDGSDGELWARINREIR